MRRVFIALYSLACAACAAPDFGEDAGTWAAPDSVLAVTHARIHPVTASQQPVYRVIIDGRTVFTR